MTNELQGLRVAILATDGVEQVELTEPRQAVQDAGASVSVVSLQSGQIQAMKGDVNQADKFDVDRTVDSSSSDDFDALLLPGGTTNPDALRQNGQAVSLVRDMVSAGKPVGVICHGSWTMIEADVVKGRTLTSYPSLRTDLANAGAKVEDKEVVVDGAIVSSRNPDDLPAFCRQIVETFSAAKR